MASVTKSGIAATTLPANKPTPKTKPKGVSVDPDAAALFDRAVKLYSGCKTLRMRWKILEKSGDSSDLTFFFARPSRSYVQWYWSGLRQVFIVDGKLLWTLLHADEPDKHYFKESCDKEKSAVENALSFFVQTPGPGEVLTDWLQGRHELQLARIKEMSKRRQYIQAKKLTTAQWKGRSWERVQVRYQFNPEEGWPVSPAAIYWLAPDNARLVKMEEFDNKGEAVATLEMLEQTFDAAIPASTFTVKLPRGAKIN